MLHSLTAVAGHRWVKQHREPRAALHQRPDSGAVRAEDEVALPVARYRSVLGLSGTLADHDLLGNEALATPTDAGSGDPERPAAAQARRELSSQCTAALHVERLVDRAVSRRRCISLRSGFATTPRNRHIYPVVFLDCMVLKIREGGTVQRRALYLALGVTLDGDRDVLGMWFQETEGAKFWMQVLNDLKTRGVKDILIACVDGLSGFPEAIEAIFPKTTVQTCVVHLIRASLRYVPRREREQVARDLKPIYTAKDADQAHAELEAFDEKWGKRFPVITQTWLNAWEHMIPFLAFPAEVRRVIYTTNAIEALNRQLRKAIKTKGSLA